MNSIAFEWQMSQWNRHVAGLEYKQTIKQKLRYSMGDFAYRYIIIEINY